MTADTPSFTVKLADSEAELRAAQRLRYAVFVEELGGTGAMVDHDARLERDHLDPYFDHLLLFDTNREPSDQVVGVYRLMRAAQARQAGQFYTQSEYDLAPLFASGLKLLELGRSCLHADYRGGTAVYELWAGLADYVERHGLDLLFGVASFHGTQIAPLTHPLAFLHHNHLAPPELRVRALPRGYQAMDLLAPDQIDRRAAMLATPALIKAYLRLGGLVGQGAFVDRDFNTTDICLLLDTARIDGARARLYTRARTDR